MQDRARDFYAAPWRIPTLATGNYGHSTRQTRSERREAALLVLGCLLHYCDLLTLRVGSWSGETWLGLGEEKIAEETGLSLRRVQSAMRDLRRAGLVSCHPIAEKQSDGTFRGRWAIRALNAGLWEAFGLAAELRDARQRAMRPEVVDRIRGAAARVPGREHGRKVIQGAAWREMVRRETGI